MEESLALTHLLLENKFMLYYALHGIALKKEISVVLKVFIHQYMFLNNPQSEYSKRSLQTITNELENL